MKTNIYFKVAVSTLVLFLLDYFFNNEVIYGINVFIWKLLSDLLIVLLLTYYILNSSLRGFKLAVAVFVILFIIGNFNIIIEAYIFNVTTRKETSIQILHGFIIAFIASPIFININNKWKGKTDTIFFKKRSVFSWIWRIVVGIFLYLFLYLTAGFILQATYPELLDFYKDKIPPFDLMIGTQFLRGLIFVVVAILILRTLKELKSKKAIFIGLVFAILGGIAPLIIPNDLMPHNIRMGHLFEVGSSNFIYGFILAYLLSQQQISEDQNKIE